MRLAYADPPYLGCCKLYGHHHPEGPRPFDGRCWDSVETHRLLIEWLDAEFMGWALSMGADDLREIAPLLPDGSRVAAWCKSFASFKPNVNPGYCWEAVVFSSSRTRERTEPTVRDFLVCPITLRKGFTGAKPEQFCSWVLDLVGWHVGDYLEDVFPGTGVMGRVIEKRLSVTQPFQLEMVK